MTPIRSSIMCWNRPISQKALSHLTEQAFLFRCISTNSVRRLRQYAWVTRQHLNDTVVCLSWYPSPNSPARVASFIRCISARRDRDTDARTLYFHCGGRLAICRSIHSPHATTWGCTFIHNTHLVHVASSHSPVVGAYEKHSINYILSLRHIW